MKRIFTLTALAVIMAFLPAFGASAAEVRIGVIDTQRIIMQSKTTMELRANFLKELEGKRNELLEKQKEAQMLEEELKTKGAEMTLDTRRDKADLLSRKIKELNRMKEEIEAEAKRKDDELSRKFLREIGDILKDFQKKEKYTIIFEKSNIVANDDAIDITEKIIELYDSGK